MLQTTDGRPGAPLLDSSGADDEETRGRYGYVGNRRHPARTPSAAGSHATTTFSRSQQMRSHSPAANAHLAARRKYAYASFFLAVSLISFTVQTELAAYVAGERGWDKAYCMLYLTHGSWALLWPAQLLALRLRQRDVPWPAFWRRHMWLLRTTAQMVQARSPHVPPRPAGASPLRYMLRTTAVVTTALTVAGLSWYVAVNKTTPGDLTAIYNCSAFFAYAFSVPLLGERLRAGKSAAVAIAIVGVLVVAYGDSGPDAGGDSGSTAAGDSRLMGNLIIGAGSVLYGLYEVLYKRLACPPEGTSPGRGVVFANAFGSMVGMFTLLVLWVPLPVLHVLGWERFELPRGSTAALLLLSVVMNATFAGSFLVLISLTSPVLSSVASLLTIFIVALVDWVRTGRPLSAAAVLGGALIVLAFGMLSWSTWKEMAEDERRREVDIDAEDDGGEEEEEEESDIDKRRQGLSSEAV